MLKFRNRVEVKDGVGRRLRFVSEMEARLCVESGRAAVESSTKGAVDTIRILETQQPLSAGSLGLWPGSYGIAREPMSSGNTIFKHRETWDGSLQAA